MPFLEIAGAFATIVGLLADYKQEVDSRKVQERKNFIEWLEYHHHEQLKDLICNNAALHYEINQLIRGDTQTLLAKVATLEQVLASVAFQVEEFRGLTVAAVRPDHQIPEAIELLKKLVGCGRLKFQIRADMRTAKELLAWTRGDYIRIPHSVDFLEDDLATLVDWGFLRKDSDSCGEPEFLMTRRGEKLVKELVGEAQPPRI